MNLLHLFFFDLNLRLLAVIDLVPDADHCILAGKQLHLATIWELLRSSWHAQKCLGKICVLVEFALVTFLELDTVILVDGEHVDPVITREVLGSTGLVPMFI